MIHRYYAGKVGWREFKMNHQSNCLKLGHEIRIVSVVRGKLFQREIQSNRSTEKKIQKKFSMYVVFTALMTDVMSCCGTQRDDERVFIFFH